MLAVNNYKKEVFTMKTVPFTEYRKRNYLHIVRNWKHLPELREKYNGDIFAYASDKKARVLEYTTATAEQAEDLRKSIINQLERL